MKLKPIIKNKKAQAQSIIIFFVMAVVIFIVAIIILRFTNEILTPFANVLNNTGTAGQIASASVTSVHNSFSTVWDWVIVIAFFLNVILLLVSAFLVDIHPAFIVIYMFAVIFLFIFGNNFLYVLDSIWNNVATGTEIAQTPIQQFIINNFQMIMLGIVILSGVLMYAKVKLFSGQGAGGNN